MKKIIVTAALCLAVTGVLLEIPDLYMKSIPTVKSVSVKKIEYEDTLELNGSIVKNAANGEMSVVAYVGEKDISLVREGQSAEITGDAFPDCVYTGEVSEIAENAVLQSKGGIQKSVVEVRISIDCPDKNLRAGYTAAAKLRVSDPETITIVPYEAVKQDDDGEYVYILENNAAVKKYIATGRELSDGIEVTYGIDASDRVINVEDESDEGKTVFVDFADNEK